MAFKVLLPQDIAKEGKEYLLEHGYEIKMGTGITEQDIIRDVEDCDAILLRTAQITGQVLKAGKKLKIVARHGVGYDNIDVEAATALGIWVANAPESNSGSVAEFTMSMILAAAKKMVLLRDSLQKGDFFFKTKNKGIDLEGKTLGVVGFGRIGRLVSKKAAMGFDMHVVAYDPYSPADSFPDYVKKAESLEYLLQCADVVTLHMPAAPNTMGMIGKTQFEQMKRSAWLVNCARGEVLREDELVEALRTGLIAGAAIDVYCQEPPAPDNPLLSMPNVIATPHIASNTDESMTKMALHSAMEIHRMFSGEQLKWPVNRLVSK